MRRPVICVAGPRWMSRGAEGTLRPSRQQPRSRVGTGLLLAASPLMKPDSLLVVGGVAHAKLGQATADDVGDHGERRKAPTVFPAKAVGVKVGGE
jgi:hypothetical protein